MSEENCQIYSYEKEVQNHVKRIKKEAQNHVKRIDKAGRNLQEKINNLPKPLSPEAEAIIAVFEVCHAAVVASHDHSVSVSASYARYVKGAEEIVQSRQGTISAVMTMINIIMKELPKEKHTRLRNELAFAIEDVKSGNKFPSHFSEKAQDSYVSVLEQFLERFEPIQPEDPDIIPWPKPS